MEKGISQAYEIQSRLKIWHPRRAAVMGAGSIGLLATLALRLRVLEVTNFVLDLKPYLNSDLIEAVGGRYESRSDHHPSQISTAFLMRSVSTSVRIRYIVEQRYVEGHETDTISDFLRPNNS